MGKRKAGPEVQPFTASYNLPRIAVVITRLIVIVLIIVVLIGRWKLASVSLIAFILVHAYRILEAEVQFGFCRNVEFLAFRQNLGTGTRARSQNGPDGCSLTAAGQCPNQRTCQSAATDIFSGALVCA